MKHYKDPISNQVYAFDSDQENLIPNNYVEITNDEELETLRTESHEAFLNSLAYHKQRQWGYPSIGDQLDALFHAGVFPEEMAAQIQAVKDKYPKGGA
jgi:hypothetical protein